MHLRIFPALASSLLILFGASSALAAWTGPPGAPPGGNVAAPINVSNATQTKATGGGIIVGGWLGVAEQTSPLAQLEVNGTAAVNALAVFGNALFTGYASSTQFCLNSNCIVAWPGAGQWTNVAGGINYSGGNVGIGAATPGAKLEVDASYGGGGNGILLYGNSVTSNAPVMEVRGRRNDGNASQSFTGGLALAHLRTDAAIASGGALGTIYFGGNQGSGAEANLLYSASISGLADGAFASGASMPTALAFYTGLTGNALGTNISYGTERMRITSVGNVGVATTTPGSLLSLGTFPTSVANFSAATSTFYGTGGINLKSGCFAVNGTCVGGGGGGTIGGSGNTNTIPRWTAATTLGNSSIASDGISATSHGNIFVGGGSQSMISLSTTTDVATGAWIRSNGVDTVFSTNVGNLLLGYTGYASKVIHIGNANPGVVQITGSAPAGSLVIPSSGNVGIGTPAPGNKLSVAGTLGVSESGGSGGRLLISSSGSGAVINQNDNSPIIFQSLGVELARMNNNGNVGVATTTPGSLLSLGTFPTSVANFSAATSTFYGTGGINLKSGCFAVNGTCISSSGGSGGTINSGGYKYVAYYSTNPTGTTLSAASALSADTVSATANGNFNVTSNLAVTGTASVTNTFTQSGGYAYLGSFNSGPTPTYPVSGTAFATGWNFTNGGRDMSLWNTDTNNTAGSTNTSFAFRQLTGASTRTDLMTIKANGNVGIGQTSPTASLQITKSTASGVMTDLLTTNFDGNWGLRLQQNFTGAGNIQYDWFERYASNDYPVLTFKGGSVGIGTTAPGNKLSVAGTLGVSESGGSGGRLLISSSGSGAVINQNDNSPIIFQSLGVELARMNNNGNVGVGTASPGYKLDVAGTGHISGTFTADSLATFNGNDVNGFSMSALHSIWTSGTLNADGQDANGYGAIVTHSVHVGGNVVASQFLYDSDRRLKKNIAPLPDALSKLMQLEGVTYNWIDPSRGTDNQIGFIAQDVQKVVPEVVHTDASTTLEAIDYARLTPVIVNAIKEQEAKIDAQRKEIDDLKTQIEHLRGN